MDTGILSLRESRASASAGSPQALPAAILRPDDRRNDPLVLRSIDRPGGVRPVDRSVSGWCCASRGRCWASRARPHGADGSRRERSRSWMVDEATARKTPSHRSATSLGARRLDTGRSQPRGGLRQLIEHHRRDDGRDAHPNRYNRLARGEPIAVAHCRFDLADGATRSSTLRTATPIAASISTGTRTASSSWPSPSAGRSPSSARTRPPQ